MKSYRVADESDEFEATVDVDTDLLTAELATQINDFWSGNRDRLAKQGDVVLTVVRLFASRGISAAAEDGTGYASGRAADFFTVQVLDSEGWPGSAWKGLKFVSIGALVPEFDDLTLEALP